MTDPGVTVAAVSFGDLDATTAYAVWRLRQDVFVVEQESPYPDLDGRDVEPGTVHVVLREGHDVVGYARVLADLLMTTSLESCPGRDVVLDAQSPLADWYARLGFTVDGDEFVEDGIPHVPMRRPGGFPA
jgi:ElaA protein